MGTGTRVPTTTATTPAFHAHASAVVERRDGTAHDLHPDLDPAQPLSPDEDRYLEERSSDLGGHDDVQHLLPQVANEVELAMADLDISEISSAFTIASGVARVGNAAITAPLRAQTWGWKASSIR